MTMPGKVVLWVAAFVAGLCFDKLRAAFRRLLAWLLLLAVPLLGASRGPGPLSPVPARVIYAAGGVGSVLILPPFSINERIAQWNLKRGKRKHPERYKLWDRSKWRVVPGPWV